MLVIFHSIKYIYLIDYYLFIYLFIWIISNSNSDLNVHLNSEE